MNGCDTKNIIWDKHENSLSQTGTKVIGLLKTLVHCPPLYLFSADINAGHLSLAPAGTNNCHLWPLNVCLPFFLSFFYFHNLDTFQQIDIFTCWTVRKYLTLSLSLPTSNIIQQKIPFIPVTNKLRLTRHCIFDIPYRKKEHNFLLEIVI